MIRAQTDGGVRGAATAPLAAGGVAVLGLGLAAPLPPAGVALALGLYALAARLAAAAFPRDATRFGAANALTLLRLVGAAVFAGFLVAPGALTGAAAWAAAGIAAALLALDGADGWIARRQGLATAFGARFDMETDALTILVLAALALALGKAGVWVLALGAMRYAFVAAGWARPALAAPLPPSLRRKAVCVLQVATLAALLAPALTPPVSTALAALALGALIWSFTVDVAWLLRAAAR